MATNVYSLSINYNIGGQFATNVLHWQFDDSGYLTTALAAHALAVAVQTGVQTQLLAAIPSATTLLSYRCRRITGVGGFEAQVLLAPGTVGGRASNLMVSGICPVLIFYPSGNLKQRGRMFVPGLADGDALDGQILSGQVTRLKALINAILTPVTLAGGGAPVASPVLWSRRLLSAAIITQGAVSVQIGQLRRRQLPA